MTEHSGSPPIVGRPLKVASVVAPVAFVAVGELVRFHLERSPLWSASPLHLWRVILYLGFVALIAGFALVMLRLIERAETRVTHENRDLVLANRLSSPRHGQADAATVVTAAATALAETSGADRVRLRLFGKPGSDHETLEAESGPRHLTGLSPTIDQPLGDPEHPAGQVQVWAAPGSDAPTWIGPRTLDALSHQIASAVHLARSFGELYRRRDEGHAFYDVLLEIGRQSGTLPTLTGIAGHTARLLGADASAVVLDAATAARIRFDSPGDVPVPALDGSALLGVGLPEATSDDPASRVNPLGSGHWKAEADSEIGGPSGAHGTLWVGRIDHRPFSERDRAFLATMAGLAALALTGAQVREDARQQEVLNERTRIAREMHDSLAQVLGAVHLRLRMLATHPQVEADPGVASEVESLADACDDAYRDVREAILGLRDSRAKAQKGLEDNLRAYLVSYSEQSGIATEFRNELGSEIVLSPRTEVHLIRVVQEALTNVRKHSGARSASVTVTGTDTATTFTITDDGCGFDAPTGTPTTEGYGLFTMHDRLALLHGTLTIVSAPGEGTSVVATVPEPVRPATRHQGAS